MTGSAEAKVPPPNATPLGAARRSQRIAAALGAYALAGGALSLAGWVADIRRLTDWVDRGISIQPTTAVAAMAAGAALILFTRDRRRSSASFAVLAGLIAIATLFEHVSGVSLGIDTLLTFGRPWANVATVEPGRMGLPATSSWILLGAGLVLAQRGERARGTAAAMGVAATLIAALSLIGYLFGADPLFSLPRLTAVAGQTSTLILAVALGLLAALADRQPMRMLLEHSASGLLARRALPAVIGLPVVLGLLVLRGRAAGLYDRGMGFALLVLGLVVIMSAGLWSCAAAVAAHERALAAASHALRENEQRFRRLADAMPQIVFTTDPDGRIAFTNQQWKDYTGEPGGRAADLTAPVHPDDLSSLHERWERARKSGEEHAAEHRLRRADGAYRWFLTRAVPVRDERGAIAQWYGTSTDIDDQKRAELMLQESERRFRAFADAAPAMLWVTEPDGSCSFLSRGWYEFTGQTEREALGFGWMDAVHPEDRGGSRESFLAAMGRHEPFTVEQRVARLDGEYRWTLAAGRPRFGPGGELLGYSGSVIDVDDRKRAEGQLRQAAKMEAIGRLAGGIAHDFNNQLHAVSGFANLAAGDRGLGARARQDLQEVLKSAERMAALTRQLLAFSRQQLLQPETLELNAAVLDGSSLLQRLIGAHVEMELELAAEPTWVQVDRAQLLQMLMNLAINARDAMPGGGRLRISTGRRKDGSHIVLSVADSGSGIAAEHLPHLFEPFFTTKGVGEGTGLGLATVHGIVAQSHGQIEVESEPGRGTTFTVLLPAVTEPIAAPHVAPSLVDSTPRPARILVVDDEEIVRAVVARTLEGEGYEVLQARDGREALEQLGRARGSVDVLLSDVVMPVLGGRELGARLAAEHPELPVIWMSGYTRDTAFGDGHSDGTQLFLQKPILADLLVRTVHDVVARRETLQEV
ncbi:MAG TPA: PAS domain S-box protein [Gemmatimonadales bacterium]|nr:PAS domain S-box protein [Gemmatimonadales bacterium]